MQFRIMVDEIGKVNSLFTSLNQNNCIPFLLNFPANYVKEQLESFRRNFNAAATTFSFINSPPCPTKEVQIMTDDIADCRDIITGITGYLNNPNVPNEQRVILSQRIQEFQENIQSYGTAEQKQGGGNQVLSPQDIRAGLASVESKALRQTDFEIQKKIGTGGFANVFLGLYKPTQKIVAVKILHNNEITAQLYDSFKREIEIQAKLDHFAILPFVGVCLDPPYYIATEYMSGDCLFKRLHQRPALDPTKRTIIALGTALGLHHMHKQGLIHRDIKSLNVLLDADDFPKICDFGMSRVIPKDPTHDVMTGLCGTAQWEAPEVINSQPYDDKADVYSFAIMLWELLTGEVPFRGLSQMQVAMNVVNNAQRPVIPHDCPPKLKKFICVCWDQDPKRRPTMLVASRVIASGEIVFPGTNMNVVRAYLSRFRDADVEEVLQQKKAPKMTRKPTGAKIAPTAPTTVKPQRIELRPDVPSASLIRQAVEMLAEGEYMPVIEFMEAISVDRAWAQNIKDSEIADKIVEFLQHTDNSNICSRIISICARLYAEGALKADRLKAVVDGFVRLGNSSMLDIPYIIEQAIGANVDIGLNSDLVAKLVPFLQSNVMQGRINASNMFALIVSKRILEANALMQIIQPTIANLTAGGVDLLNVTLALIIHCLQCPGMPEAFAQSNAVVSLTQVVAPEDDRRQITPAIRQYAFQVMTAIVRVPIKPDVVHAFAGEMLGAAQRLKGDELARFAAVVAFVFQGDVPSSTSVEKLKIFVDTILSNEHPPAVLIGLKIAYAFLAREESNESFRRLGPKLTKLLVVQIPAISAGAAACLLHILPAEEDEHEALYNAELYSFLMAGLKEESELTFPALRLFGVISQTIFGALFLQNNSITEWARRFILSDTPEIKRLAFMALAAFTTMLPMSSAALEVTPTVMQSIGDDSLTPYPLIFISNIVVHPDAAPMCAPSLGALVRLFETADTADGARILNALINIFSVPEARDCFEDANTIGYFFCLISKVVDTELWESYVQVVDLASGTPTGRSVLAQTPISATFVEKLKELENGSWLRPLMLRVLVRAGVKTV